MSDNRPVNELERTLSQAYDLAVRRGRKVDAIRLLRETLVNDKVLRIVAVARLSELRALKAAMPGGNLERRCHVSNVHLELLEAALPEE